MKERVIKIFFFLALVFLVSLPAKTHVFENNLSDNREKDTQADNVFAQHSKAITGRVNIFVFTRERKNKIDLLAFCTLLRARVKSLFHHRKEDFLIAGNYNLGLGKIHNNDGSEPDGTVKNRYFAMKIGYAFGNHTHK
ncbi:MAG: hypothetical protein ABIO76_03365 [Ginsengibacter sp.]